MAPRQKLITNFKTLCEIEYSSLFFMNISNDILNKKLILFVNSIIKYLNEMNYSCNNLTLVNSSDSISILLNNTLLRTYTLDHMKSLKNESQLSMALFIEYGYLIKYIKKVTTEQLCLVL